MQAFIYQQDGQPAFCAACVKEDPEGTLPLPYPPVLVCLKAPEPETFKEKGHKLVRWHWEWTKLCVPHAQQLLPEITEKEITPVIKKKHKKYRRKKATKRKKKR